MSAKLLGSYVADARAEKGWSLRDVEAELKRRNSPAKISSGHLSLIESGDVKRPSPHTLEALSEVLELDYIELMILAGYLKREQVNPAPRPAPAFSTQGDNLTAEQRDIIRQLIKTWRLAD